MLNYIKELVRTTSNDMDLGAKVRAYVNRSKTCCDDHKNHMTRSVSYTQINEENKEVYCKICGKFIKHG